jgi:hypothetical protein
METPRTRCSLRQSPLMTRLPRSPGSTLVLRFNQETVHDFILLFMPPYGPHLTPLATGSLEQSLLVFSTPGGHTGDDLSRLFFTCTNTSQAATCTCNTLPRISPHNVVNHSSHKQATIHRSSNHTWSSDDNRRDERRRDEPQPEDCRDERDLPPPPATGNPNSLFQ